MVQLRATLASPGCATKLIATAALVLLAWVELDDTATSDELDDKAAEDCEDETTEKSDDEELLATLELPAMESHPDKNCGCSAPAPFFSTCKPTAICWPTARVLFQSSALAL